MERYAGRCTCCGGTTLAPVPDGLEQGSPFGPSIVAMALYLRFTHAISYRRLCRLFEHLYGLGISEGALDALFRRAKPAFDDATAAILARLRRSRIVCSDETSVRIDGRTCWNWVFQNEQVVIHVVRKSRGAGVVAEVMGGHRPVIWVSDLYGAQQGHADLWQVCLPSTRHPTELRSAWPLACSAHQLRDCQFAIDAGDTLFAPRMKALLLRAVLLARRREALAASTRRQYRNRLDRDLDAIMALSPTNRHGQRLRKRYGKVRNDLFTFLIHPDGPPDNNSSERELRPTDPTAKSRAASAPNGAPISSPASDPSSRLSATRYAGAKIPNRVEQIPRKISNRVTTWIWLNMCAQSQILTKNTADAQCMRYILTFPSRPEAVHRALAEHLNGKGYLPAAEPQG